MKRFSDERLWSLRNEIPIEEVIRVLEITAKEVEGTLRFLCPACHEFNTAVNPRANLARCFRCQKNYNPIDLVMIVERCSFLQAVRYLSVRFQSRNHEKENDPEQT